MLKLYMNHLLKIDDQVSQMTASILKTELQDYSAFKKHMLVLTNDDGFLEGLDEVSEPIVLYYAENSTGIPQAQAQNLLCFFLGECDEAPPVVNPSGTFMAFFTSGSDNAETVEEVTVFSVYPNPNAGLFMIKSDVPGTVHILDINGKIIFEGVVSDNELEVDLKEVQAGVYVVQLMDNGNVLEAQRLIKQ